MPNRLIREGLVESEAVNMLSSEAECFFVRLCLKADDYGRFHRNPRLLRSHLFPLKDHVQTTDVSRWLAECEKAGLIRGYSTDGKGYLCIPKFRQRLRVKRPSKFPDPPFRTDDCHVPDVRPPDDGHMTVTQSPEVGSEVGKREERREDDKREGGSGRVRGNAPTLEDALKYFSISQGADYSADEVKACWLSFEASRDQSGQWYWGARLVGDWRAAMERRMADTRNKTGRGKQRPEANQRPETINPPTSL